MFQIKWTASDEEWKRARTLAAESLAKGWSEVLLDEFLVNGTILLLVDGRRLVPIRVEGAPAAVPRPGPYPRGTGAVPPSKTHLAMGYDLPLFEFAWQLAPIVADDGLPLAPEGTEAAYYMFDEAFSLHFCKAEGAIWIRSNLLEDLGWVAPVPEADFFTGGRAFRREFVEELTRHIPRILDDEISDAFRLYVAG